MPQIASHEEVKAGRTARVGPNGGTYWVTRFLTPPQGALDHPVAFLAENVPGFVIDPHFHDVDEFQVVVSGGGVIGRHPLSPNTVHFARAHTPYGPLISDERGVGFLTLRTQWDPGAQYLPAAREKLVAIRDRKPWQVTEDPKFHGTAEVNVHGFADITDAHGLAAYALKLAPNATTAAPDASSSNGQFIIVTKGSLNYQEKDYGAISIGFTKPDEGRFPIVAGSAGVEALVLNFPRLETTAPAAVKSASRVWQCVLCSFAYDEARGMPDDGIAPGTRWEDVPDSWMCPDCGSRKGDFEMVVAG